MLTVLLLATVALAADAPSLFVQETFGASVFPNGLLSATAVEARTPLHRSDSIVFQDTYGGAGIGFAASPAFVAIGPRLSVAPIDVFDVNLSVQRVGYLDDGLGLLPYDVVKDRIGAVRDARSAEGFGAGAWVATVEPTLKLKVGPIIAFDAWTVDLIHIERPDEVDAAYVYEPYRDLIIAFDDVTVEQQGGLLYDALGEDGPSLRFGVTVKDRFAVVSRDHTTQGGLLVAARPGVKAGVPTFIAMGLVYLRDADRTLASAPNIAVAARWEIDREFGGR